jgi:hypothetical protein
MILVLQNIIAKLVIKSLKSSNNQLTALIDKLAAWGMGLEAWQGWEARGRL